MYPYERDKVKVFEELTELYKKEYDLSEELRNEPYSSAQDGKVIALCETRRSIKNMEKTLREEVLL